MTMLHEVPAARSAADAFTDFRTLIVHVEANPEAAPRLDVAVDLARRFGATLTGVGAERPQSFGAVDPFGVLSLEFAAQLEDSVGQNLEFAEAAFLAKAAGLKTNWMAKRTAPTPYMARLSRSADLIVAGGVPNTVRGANRTSATVELLMTAGRPVLVAPPGGGKFHGRAVVVAWKDTREARQAVASSLPILRRAEEVVVMEVCAQLDADCAAVNTADVCAYLQRHGVPATAKVNVDPKHRIADQLNAQADAIGADLIVAGAYGHSRLGEWAFGGVTQDLLLFPERFVLLSH